ncbi:MAG: WecB/TagA/CpsF family glycosyltransferase [Actinomycetota bacterium]|nr:WecB/TagA/CpsF family glycosyltransferase [Actinomycetota bacterium]
MNSTAPTSMPEGPRPVATALVAGIPVDDVTMDQTVEMIGGFIDVGRATGRTFQLATINVDFVVNAQRDDELRAILQRADVCMADGMPIVWYAQIAGVPFRERVAGADLVPALVDRSRARGWRVLLFGSAEGVAESAAAMLVERFPGAIVHGMSGPMLRDVRAMDDEWTSAITAFRPDVICVALGNPKQEKWIRAHRARLGASVLIGVGGTLDFIVGGRRRAPEWMRRFGLEWVYRASQEPARLGKRYLRDAVVFAPHMLRIVWRRVRWGAASDGGWPVSVESDCTTVHLTGFELRHRDVHALVALAREAHRGGRVLRVRGCDARSRRLLDSLGVVKTFEFT